MFTVICPGFETVMTPAQLHMSVQLLFRAGLFLIITVNEPGIQGAVDVTGMQGCGVSTPKAAEVAAATCGFAKLIHIPKGMMFFIGTLSMMVAAGSLPALVIFSGVTISELGATPKLHANIAPFTTCCPIVFTL